MRDSIRYAVRGAAGLAAWALVLCASPSSAQQAPAGPVTLLDGRSPWRVLYSWDRPMVATADGPAPRVLKPGRNVGYEEQPDYQYMSQYPADGWTKADFDDSGWARRHFLARWANGEWDYRAGGGQGSINLRQISLRGKFTVTDPAAAGAVTVSLSYRGGAAVYVNGREVARGHLPVGPIAAGAVAEAYPDRAFLKEDGKPWSWWNDRDVVGKEAYPLRVRTIEKVAIPAERLRKGTNVLAVEVHAAPYPEPFGTRGMRPEWATCGLIDLRLEAPAGSAVAPNVTRPTGFRAWNTNTAEDLYDLAWGDPHEPLGAVRLAGPRNGCASARVAVGIDPAAELRASIGPLATTDGRKLPPEAVRVCFGRFVGPEGSRWGGAADAGAVQWGSTGWRRDDALCPSPAGGAVRAVWVVAEIPAGAAAGAYRGTLTISAVGQKPIEAPVELSVIDWTLPNPAKFTYFLGMIQCPEGPALTYEAPLWSDRHCRLVAESLRWIGKLGPKVLQLPLTAESQYGNQRSLVTWVRDGSGRLTHDFSAVEKYVDLALEHMGKPQFVVLGVWDSCMHISTEGHRRKFPRYTVRSADGTLSNADGPVHGSVEGEAFWKPVLGGVRDLLAKRGLTDRMALGYVADQGPDKATVGVFHRLLPNAGWQATRHIPRGYGSVAYEGGTVPILYQANVWGGWDHWDPATRRPYGWKFPLDPSLRTWLDRGLFDASSIPQFRTACEQALLADRRGLGQIGADFWPTPGDKEVRGGTLVGRYPATSEGNLGIYAGQLLYPAPEGPVPTARYQMMRENIQECEARIFLEKLLTSAPCPLPAGLPAKAQAVLDERTRWHRVASLAAESVISWPYSGWEDRSARLYAVAGEAARAVEAR
ncbi:MAG TPA: glycoside hydrolase domain-containing protein [Phycisphaerae bacterium]|nr:glycoside hydrolase domain-containing protein [Phycisphaerae bacterium]